MPFVVSLNYTKQIRHTTSSLPSASSSSSATESEAATAAAATVAIVAATRRKTTRTSTGGSNPAAVGVATDWTACCSYSYYYHRANTKLALVTNFVLFCLYCSSSSFSFSYYCSYYWFNSNNNRHPDRTTMNRNRTNDQVLSLYRTFLQHQQQRQLQLSSYRSSSSSTLQHVVSAFTTTTTNTARTVTTATWHHNHQHHTPLRSRGLRQQRLLPFIDVPSWNSLLRVPIAHLFNCGCGQGLHSTALTTTAITAIRRSMSSSGGANSSDTTSPSDNTIHNDDDNNNDNTSIRIHNDNDTDRIIRERTMQWLRDIVIGYNFCPFAYTPYIQNQIRIVILHLPKPSPSDADSTRKKKKKQKNQNEQIADGSGTDIINPILQTVMDECDLLLQGIKEEQQEQGSSINIENDSVVDTTITPPPLTTSNYPTTTLIVCPDCYPNDFEKYLEVVNVIEDMIEIGYDDDGNEIEMSDEEDIADIKNLIPPDDDSESDIRNTNDAAVASEQSPPTQKETYQNPYYGQIQVASFHPEYCFTGSTNKDDPDNKTNQAPYPIFHLLREMDIDHVVNHLLPNQDAAVVWSRNVDLLQALHTELTKEEFQLIFNHQQQQQQQDEETIKELQARARQIVRRFPIQLLKSTMKKRI